MGYQISVDIMFQKQIMYLILNVVAVVWRRYNIERAKRAKNKSKDEVGEVDEGGSWRTTLLIGPLLLFLRAVWKIVSFKRCNDN